MTAPRSLPALLLALSLTVLASAWAAPSAAAVEDRPTEDPRRVRLVQAAADYAEMESDRCSYATADGMVGVDCRRRGVLWMDYRFDVPAEAINLRASFEHRVAPDSPGDYTRLDGHRGTRTSYEVSVNVARGTEVVIEEVRLRYDLPTTVDDRPCVTRGEWATIDASRGGSGGSKRQVATIFDHRGTLVERSGWQSGYRYQVRSYPRCGSERTAQITFHRYRDQRGWHSYWG